MALTSQFNYLGLVSIPSRAHMPQWDKKNKANYKPTYFDNVRRSPSGGQIKYNSQDPLYFDYRHESLNGGIKLVN
jgi:hypothetical protein